MTNILKSIDLFSEPFSFSLNGKGPKRSKFGGFFTLVSILGSIMVSYFLLLDFVQNRKATLVPQVQYNSSAKSEFVDSKEFQFSFSLWDFNTYIQERDPFIFSFFTNIQLSIQNIFFLNNKDPWQVSLIKGNLQDVVLRTQVVNYLI
jgi:hypothetical protein